MARAAKVIALHSFDDDEALMYLSDVGRVEMALSDLAQQFGWTLTKLRRSHCHMAPYRAASHANVASANAMRYQPNGLRP